MPLKFLRKPAKHSRCVQMRVNNICRDAVTIFSMKQSNGEIPLVIIPNKRSITSPYMRVPSGVFCLVSHYGKNVGVWDPGLYVKPFTYRVAYVVTKQSVSYDAPVKSCPTSDNVRVSVDTVLIFQIVDPEKFIYKLGASNFDEYLTATVEEGIRLLVRGVSHDKVYNLRGDQALGMLRTLNQTFSESGVRFTDCLVTGVWLPEELSECLEKSTMTEKAMSRVKRQDEFEIFGINMESEMSIEEIKRTCEQSVVKENGRKRRAEIDFEQRSVKAEETGRVNLIKIEQQTEVDITLNETELARTKTKLETWRLEELAKAEAAAVSAKIKAEEQEEIITAHAEAKECMMVSDAEILKHEATTERIATKCLASRRQHEVVLREKKILGAMAEKGKFNLIGAPGDRLINSMMKGTVTL